MKLLDRYVISSFLKNYAISLVTLIGLYIVLDMVFNLDVLTKVKTDEQAGALGSLVSVVKEIGTFYFYKAFVFFVQLSGMIPVVAAAFTLMRLARFNELTAMMAAGIPLQRVALPVVMIGAVINLALLPINQELVIPRMIPQLMRDVDDLSRTGRDAFTVTGMADGNRLISIARYTPPKPDRPATMEYLDILERDDDFRLHAHTTADGATWDEATGQWNLTNGWQTTNLRPATTGPTLPPRREPVAVYKGSVTPQELAVYRRGRYVDLLSLSQIHEMLERPQRFGRSNLLRVRHTRVTQWLTNIILLLLAIPCILTREPNKLKHAAGLTLAMTGLCMGSVFLFQQMASNNLLGDAWADNWPALMAWMPIFIWGPVAILLLERTKT
jgi:lipopolysaccharide export LptBFGC system permease protein LptF